MNRQITKKYEDTMDLVVSLGDEINRLEQVVDDLQTQYDELEEKYNSLLETTNDHNN